MLQIYPEKVEDICRISKLLVEYNVNARISNQVITLDGEISEELLNKFCDIVTICKVQNYHIAGNSDSNSEEDVQEVTPKNQQYNTVIYPNVKRGEVYYCDFGDALGHEKNKIRPAIIVQSDKINSHANTTIVVPCTTNTKRAKLKSKYKFNFYNRMVSHNSHYKLKVSCADGEQIRVIDKTRIRAYIGTMSTAFMDELQKTIDFTLDLKRDEKTGHTNAQASMSSKNMNVTIKILSFVNVEDLFKVSESMATDEVKAEEILKLFKFDLEKTGVSYLLQAILISTQNAYFNLETVCEEIFKNTHIKKEEVERVIVARIKERFGFKKSPAIDFIRLVKSVLTQKEDI